MQSPSSRCTICRSFMDDEDLFCANCGTENPQGGFEIDFSEPDEDHDGSLQREVQKKVAIAQQASIYAFQCQSCGASMSYDASSRSLRCPFCGSTSMVARANARTLRPSKVVPFRVSRDNVTAILKQWLATGFWRPNDAATASVLSEVTQVYVPFWIFSATTQTEWTADVSPPPVPAKSNWYPVSGSQRNQYSGILVPASGILMSNETEAIAPFNLNEAVNPEAVDTTNTIVEEFRVPRKEARPLARSIIEQLEARASKDYVRGSTRNLHVNVMLADMHSEPILLPIWIMVYRYRNQPFRVLVNGQTGEIQGNAPISYTKVSMAFIALFLFIVIFILISFLSGTVASR